MSSQERLGVLSREVKYIVKRGYVQSRDVKCPVKRGVQSREVKCPVKRA